MKLYPAIDLREGRCVRLSQGRFNRVTEYSDDPPAWAVELERQGAPALHVVDLDGARLGRPVQLELVGQIAAAVSIPVQLGGGLRTTDHVSAALDAGIWRVLLGSALARDSSLGRHLGSRFEGRVGAAVDALGGRVRVDGWQRDSDLDSSELMRRLWHEGIRLFLCTEISRDGMLSGPELDWYRRLRTELPEAELLASGGVGTLDDLIALRSSGLDGAVLGKALYERRFALSEALLAAGHEGGHPALPSPT